MGKLNEKTCSPAKNKICFDVNVLYKWVVEKYSIFLLNLIPL